MPVALKDSHVRGLKPNQELRDSVVPNFAIRRQGEGRVAFILVWQKDGKARRHTLGFYETGGMTLKEAREEATKQRRAIMEGGTPGVRTVKDLFEKYIASLGKSKDQVTALLNKHVLKDGKDARQAG